MGARVSQVPDEKWIEIKNEDELFRKYPEVREKLNNKYKLEDRLFLGRFGVLFAAKTDMTINHVIKVQDQNDEVTMSCFKTMCAQKAMSRYMVSQKLEDCFFISDKLAIQVFEYLGGGNLHDFIQASDDGLSEEQAARFYLQIGNGLLHLHEEGYAHNNLKPRNILLDASKTVAKISDFRMSINCYDFHTGEAVEPQEPTGTPNYMPPECSQRYNAQRQQQQQLQSEEKEKKALAKDIWAMGVMLFEMVHGFVPWEYTQNQEEQLLKNLEKPIILTLFPRGKQTSRQFMKFLVEHFVENPLKRPEIEQLLHDPFLVKGINCQAKKTYFTAITEGERNQLKTAFEDDLKVQLAKHDSDKQISEKILHEVRSQGYQIAKKLGIGGFGYVCAGKFKDSLCAIKLQLKPFDAIKEEILRELTFMKKLNHPNVVEVMDFFLVENRLAIVSPAATGGDLFGYIVNSRIPDRNNKPRRGLSEEQASRFYLQIGSGLEYCHRMGVAHKDLKPENILLDETRTVCMITDFGLATYAYNLQSGEQQIVHYPRGTYVYWSPEYCATDKIHQHAIVETRADIWAMGTIMYFMKTQHKR